MNGKVLPFHVQVAVSEETIQGVNLSAGSSLEILGPCSDLLANKIFESASGKTRSLPFDWERVSCFSKNVLSALLTIPPGETRSYGEIANLVGVPRGARAVGGACNRNPFPLLIPCHRVVGAHDLGGYAFGLELKKHLLECEEILFTRS